MVRDPLANNGYKPAGALGAASWNVTHRNYNAGSANTGDSFICYGSSAWQTEFTVVSAAAFAGFVTNFAFTGAARKW